MLVIRAQRSTIYTENIFDIFRNDRRLYYHCHDHPSNKIKYNNFVILSACNKLQSSIIYVQTSFLRMSRELKGGDKGSKFRFLSETCHEAKLLPRDLDESAADLEV